MAAPFLALRIDSGTSPGQLLHVLTPRTQESVYCDQPPAPESALGSLLPLAAREELSRCRREHACMLLVLNRNLPDSWQHTPWESLKFENSLLTDSVLVARRGNACLAHDANKIAAKHARAAWIDLFPRTEFDFRAAFQPLVGSEKMKRVKPSFLPQGVDGFRELFVLAHGDFRGVLDVQGEPFGGLDSAALPARVWLLACNEDLAMYRLAERLLARGVRTVVTTTGTISAPEMADLVTAWLMAPLDANVVEWLLERKRKSRAEGSAHALTVFGDVLLDDSIAAPWNAVTWDAWCTPQAVGYRLPENERDAFDRALAAVDAPSLWPETQDWLLPQLIALANKWDRTTMLLLQSRANMAKRTPSLLHALAESHYRMGEYVEMARYLAQGLCEAREDGIDRADLLSSLVNLLIDMDLPAAASQVADEHENCHFDVTGLTVRPAFKRLDWRARIAFKQGKFELALQEMRSKRRQNSDPQDTRELAWLLYMQPWKDRPLGAAVAETRSWVNEAIGRLAVADPDRLGNANDNESYLLRALACFGWIYRDEQALAETRRWLPKIREELSSIDPGPWAFSLAFLCLASAAPKEDIDSALSALARQGYFLEASGFCGFAGLADQQCSYFAKFCDRRSKVLAELSGIGTVLGIDFASVAERVDESVTIPI